MSLNSSMASSNINPWQSEIENVLSCNNMMFNGVILFSRENKVLYEKVHENISSSHLQQDSQFLVGSVSKQMTASIVLNLADYGLIDIDKPINEYLPNLLQEWSNKVYIRHLLNHTSGIISLNKPLEFEQGSRFKYSPTLSFYLASQIAENVSGKNFKTLAQELFDKAHMPHSGLLISSNVKKNQQTYAKLVNGFKEQGNHLEQVTTLGEEGYAYDDLWAPGGGVISSAYDLVKWNHFLHTTHFLSEKSYLRMTTSSATRPHPRYGNIGYGFGLQIYKQNDILEFSHSGYIDGYTCTLIYYPVRKLSLIILENISQDSKDIKRAFSVHDKIRKIIQDNHAIF